MIDPAGRRSHRAPFTEGPRPWLVLARNSIPVIGVFGFGWPAAVAVFEIWFDGASALGAMFFLALAVFADRDPSFPTARFRSLGLVVGGLAAFALLGIPYWFTLGALFAVFEPGSWSSAIREPLFLWALVIVLVGNLVEEWLRAYDRMSDAAIRREFNWEFHMHLARVMVTLMAAFLGSRFMIVGVALALSYVEIYPLRSLRVLGVDGSLEPEDEFRSLD